MSAAPNQAAGSTAGNPRQYEADVVVVGGGGAGLAAAAEAARLGRSVILLEKNAQPGGSTSWSVGSISATNTPHQHKAGIKDTPREHFEDLGLLAGAYAPRDNLVLRRLLTENTTDMIEWLTRLGVVLVGPMPEPPHRYPRMHNVLPNSRAFAYHISRHCRRLGVDIRCNVAAGALIREGDRVVGVEARDADGATCVFRARGGVVLAAGDFSNAPDLKRSLASEAVVDVEAINTTATGDGQRMALAIGGSVVNGDIVRGPILRFVPPPGGGLMLKLPPWRWLARFMAWSMQNMPQALLRPFMMSFLTTALGPAPELFKEGAILVNRKGERFVDELGRPAYSVPTQMDRVGYILFDSSVARKFQAWPYAISTAPGIAYAFLDDYRRNRKDIFHQAESIDALAITMGLPAARLTKTLENYNAHGRETRPALAQGPYYALGPVKGYVVFTDGGLRVTERLEVTGADGSPIPGLYAAGSTGQGGLMLEGHGHHLGWAFVSGRIAGRHAAYDVPGKAASV